MDSKTKADGKEERSEYLLREPYARTLRKWRVIRDLNQDELSKEAKLPKYVVGSLERCERPIDLTEIVKLCHALEVDPAQFSDEVNSLVQRSIHLLDTGLRAGRAKEGLKALPSEEEEFGKALDLFLEKGKQLILFLVREEKRNRFRVDSESPQDVGRKRSRPAR